MSLETMRLLESYDHKSSAGFPCHQQDRGEERCSAACLRKNSSLWVAVGSGLCLQKLGCLRLHSVVQDARRKFFHLSDVKRF